MPSENVTLTDAQLSEIEARANAATPGLAKALDANARYDGGVWSLAEGAAHHVRLALFDFQKLLPDIPALIAALRASREQQKQYETAIRDALAPLGRGGPCRMCKCEGCEVEREMAVEILSAALGEEAKS